MEASRRNSILGSAVVIAVTSSLCCVLPVLSIVLGIGAFGAASFFEELRPYLLVVSFLALGFAFYKTYFRRDECGEGETCATKPIGRINHLFLWIGTLAVVTFALFPLYTGNLVLALGTNASVDNSTPIATSGDVSGQKTVVIRVEGMTCDGCASHIDESLKKLVGVHSVKASYKNGDVKVVYDSRKISVDSIKKAIKDLGYKPEKE
ncbi:MAG: hypothetical protein HKN33_06640 [Pyrinomonadaceae bacterium]|nr:hypothetical protein [Pyrinomonadaceae bacterium]